jgi:hypothetical protein
MIITAQWLKNKGACSGQVENFIRTFSIGKAEITYDNAIIAIDNGLNLNWLGKALGFLNYKNYPAYDRAAAKELMKFFP